MEDAWWRRDAFGIRGQLSRAYLSVELVFVDKGQEYYLNESIPPGGFRTVSGKPLLCFLSDFFHLYAHHLTKTIDEGGWEHSFSLLRNRWEPSG